MKEIAWANKAGCRNFIDGIPLTHWSRKFEYPFVIEKAGLERHQITLDAAGGDAPLQFLLSGRTGVVFNIDSDAEALERGRKQWGQPNVIYRQGDLKEIELGNGRAPKNGSYTEGFFDRVICVSVLEHDPDHMDLLRELWWVLKPGGRMVLTFDVASYERWNHSIDRNGAAEIAKFFGLELPPDPPDIMRAVLPEIQRKETDPESVELRVLCIVADKEKE